MALSAALIRMPTFFGFFKNKRIVLFDTLLEQATTEEVLGVLAHELGHWQYNHVFKMLAINQLHLLFFFYAFKFVVNYAPLYEAFGFTESRPVVIGFLLFNFLVSPLDSVLSCLMNILSRKHEFEADAYAKKLGYTEVLKSGLIKLQVKNLGNMNPDSLYSIWNYSHPPLVERLNALGKTE